MWALAVLAFGAIAVVAKDLKARWEAVLLEPGVEAVAATTAGWMARTFAIDMVKRQELFLALAATLAADIAATVVN